MAEWVVKLVPFGNPEDKLFVIATQGGEPGFGDFIGWHLEQFTFTTDAAGQKVVTLAHAPTSLNTCYCLTSDPGRHIEPTSLTTTALTVSKFKLAYDKANTPTGTPTNLPAGVSSVSSNPQHALQVDAGGTGYALADGVLYDHKHAIAYTQTVVPIAASESTHLLVLYK